MTPFNRRALGGQNYTAFGGKAKGRGYMTKQDTDLTNAYNALRSGGPEALGERSKALLMQHQSEQQHAQAFKRMKEQALREERIKKEMEEMELEASRLKLQEARASLRQTQ